MTTKRPRNKEACRVIDALGGTFQVAALCQIQPASVSGWKEFGIPQARRQFLLLHSPHAFAAKRQRRTVNS